MTSFARNSTYGEVWGRIDREYRYSKTYYEVGKEIFKEIFVRSNILILKDLFKLYSSEELVCFQTVFFGRPILLKLSYFEGSVCFKFFSSLKGPVFVIKLFSFLGRVLLLKA